MAEHNTTSHSSLPGDTPRELQHHRTTSASATIDALTAADLRNVPSSAVSATNQTNYATSMLTSSVRQHYHSSSVSSMPSQYAPGPIQRGRDWDSMYRQVTGQMPTRLRLPYVEKPLKMSGFTFGGDGSQQNPSSATGDSPLSWRNQYIQNNSLSNIQLVCVLSPVEPQGASIPSSPDSSLGPQSGRNSPVVAVTSPRPKSPDSVGLPKYMSAFDYAMQPFLDTSTNEDYGCGFRLPSPIEQHDISVAPSPLLKSLQADEISYASDEEEKDIPEDGVPTHLKDKDSFRTATRFIQLRTLLMQCTILLTTVQELERKPWIVQKKRPPRWYYSKMRSLAYTAQSLAQLLESQDLQARCAYWLGRACGGTRDYQTAKEHFKLAVQLDVRNDFHRSGNTRLRGLRPAEKADVRFLLNSASARHKVWVQRDERIKAEAEHLSRGSRIPSQHYIDSTHYEPPWMPDRDRAIYLARKYLGVPTPSHKFVPPVLDASHSPIFDEQNRLEAHVAAQYADEENDIQDMMRRTLTQKEWHYIHHGDVVVARQKARQLSEDRVATPHSVVLQHDGSVMSPHWPGQDVSATALRTLQLELLDGEYEDEDEGEMLKTASLESRDGSEQGSPREFGA
jgi:hypothetical protein